MKTKQQTGLTIEANIEIILRKIKYKIQHLKEKTLYREEVFYAEHDIMDEYPSKDGVYQHYTFYIDIYKLYTLTGVYYKVNVPNYTTFGYKNVYEAIFDAMSYLENHNSPAYFRLKDHLISKDIWRKI